LRNSINTLMVHYLENAALPEASRKPLPAEEWMFIQGYEKMTEEARGQLSPNDVARATWIYYTLGLLDMQDRKFDDALRKFDAAGVSPDGLMAGDALLRVAQIRMERAEFPEARQALEHLLFAVSAVEPTVRATYLLGVCHQRLGKDDQAFRRLQEVVDRYPFSPYAETVKKEPLYIERTGSAAGTQAQEPGAPAATPTNEPAPAAVRSS
jgi:tetratricopeptide (TPR) repeat protein